MSDSDASSDDIELDLSTVLLRQMTVKQLKKQLGTRKLSQQVNKFTLEQRLVAYITARFVQKGWLPPQTRGSKILTWT